ncbi:septum formation initiator family protein [Corynebacterium tapiri]|nr:septum formation initiator family protein [Corynebacterium tapiri]
MPQLGMASWAVIGLVVILILLTILVPVKNYFQGRAEIARLEESIVAKQAEKDRLQSELDKYRDDSYIEQEARRRFGVVESGETAWRIIDPRLQPESQATTSSQDASVQPKWFEVLWDSVATQPSPAAEMHLPVQ